MSNPDNSRRGGAGRSGRTGRAGRVRPLLVVAMVILLAVVGMLSLPGTAARPDGASGEASRAATGMPGGTASAPAAMTTAPGIPVSSGSSPPGPLADSGQMRVHFLDVAQGHATLFEIGNQTLLIDGGDGDRSQFVVAYLKKLGIRQIDVMVASHYDSDHISGLVGVLNVLPVKQVYSASYTADTRVYSSFKSIIRTRGIPEDVPGMRQAIQMGGATVTFVGPREYGHRDANDDSICVRVTFGSTRFLIMGDSSADAEQQILTQDLTSDVLLAAHHGSDGSSSRTLLDRVKPAFAVISCGADNSYGHPGHNTLSRLKSTGAALYRTDRQGTIICTSDGRSLSWNQPPGNDFTPGEAVAPAPKSADARPTTDPAPTTRPTTTATLAPSGTAVSGPRAYVLNTNTDKFHYPSCGSAASILPKNRKDVVDTRDSIIRQGYDPCGNCDP